MCLLSSGTQSWRAGLESECGRRCWAVFSFPTTLSHRLRAPCPATCLVLIGGVSLPRAVSGHLQEWGVQAPVESSPACVPAWQKPRKKVQWGQHLSPLRGYLPPSPPGPWLPPRQGVCTLPAPPACGFMFRLFLAPGPHLHSPGKRLSLFSSHWTARCLGQNVSGSVHDGVGPLYAGLESHLYLDRGLSNQS